MYYLDTCICIEFLRGRLKTGYQELRNGKPGDFQLPAIVAAELWYGAEHSSNPKKECAVVSEFVDVFGIAPFDASAARQYGRLRQTLGSEGKPIGDRDTMIAATALAHHATLVTRNISEFERVPHLALESWAEVELGEEQAEVR